MNIKNLLFTSCALGLAVSLTCSPCAAGTSETEVKEKTAVKSEAADFSFLNAKTGTAISTRMSEETFKKVINKYRGSSIKKMIYSNSIADCLAMLKSGRADFVVTSDITSDYIIQRNPDLKSVNCSDRRDFAMVLRIADAPLKDALNAAIAKLKENGKAAELFKTWIKDLPVGEEPSMTKIEKVSDTAETIYVGVSGDAPPLDYVAADGKPAGFNIALLAEISKLIGKNIEIVSMDSSARYSALESKKIDVFFWQVMPAEKEIQANLKQTEDEQTFYKKFAASEPYCTVKTSFLLKK